MTTKICTGCEIEKSFDQFPFRKDRNTYRSRCRDCENKYSQERRKNNADVRNKSRLASKQYYANNKEKMNKQCREYHQAHREEHKEKCKEYYEKNKEHLKQKAKERRDKLKEKALKGELEEPKINMKVCIKCKEEKSVELFGYRKNIGAYESRCKKCLAKLEKERRQNKKKEIAKKAKENKRIKTPQMRMGEILRKRIGRVVRNIGGRNIYFELLGCNRMFFKKWFEYQFTFYEHYDINWTNHGSVWEIDHVIPCAKFDLTNNDQQKICFHWSNTSCVPKLHNLSKGSKISVPDIVSQKVRVKQFIEKLNTENTQHLKYVML